MFGFTEVRATFKTSFEGFIESAFNEENKRRIQRNREPITSIDRFIGEVGGDAAKRTYYRLMSNLKGKKLVVVREGAFAGLANSVGKENLEDWRLRNLILDYQLAQLTTGLTKDQMKATFLHCDTMFESIANPSFIKSLQSANAFREGTLNELNHLRNTNQYEIALDMFWALFLSLLTNMKSLGLSRDGELLDYHLVGLLRLAAIMSIETNDPIQFTILIHYLHMCGNNRRRNRIHYHYALSQNKLEYYKQPSNIIGSYWRTAKSASPPEIASAAHRSLAFAEHELEGAFRDECIIASECAHAVGYSMMEHGTNGELHELAVAGLREPTGEYLSEEGYPNMWEYHLPRFVNLSKWLNTEIGRSDSGENGARLASLWLAMGHLSCLETKQFVTGVTPWECAKNCLQLLIRGKLESYSLWCDWYLLCARIFKASNDVTGYHLALERASEVGEKLGTGGRLQMAPNKSEAIGAAAHEQSNSDIVQILAKKPPCFKFASERRRLAGKADLL